MQSREWDVLEPSQDRRDGVLGRERLHADRYVRRGHVYRRESGDVRS
jgi:hypothetical protein